MTTSIRFDPAKVEKNQFVSIFYYNEEKQMWIDLNGTIDGEWITTEVNDFGTFAVISFEEEPEVRIPWKEFSDIAGHWGEAYILKAAERNLVNGYPDGTFRPNQAVTRSEFLVMMVKTLGLENMGGTTSFTDEDRIGAWAKDAVAIAVQQGIVNGYPDGSFRPDAPITRVEMAMMIARALEMNYGGETPTSFADDTEIPAWAKGAVAALREQGLVQGRNGNLFAPQASVTRAEAVVLLLRVTEYRK